MKCNLASWDRSLRFTFGTLLLTYAIAGGPSWAYVGVYLLLTSAWGLCVVYSFWNIKTLQPPMRNRVGSESEINSD